MTKDEAMQQALGYAAGQEDASGRRTASPSEGPGFIAFAEAYSAAVDEFNREVRYHIPCLAGAYAAWQYTSGRTVVDPRFYFS